MNHVPAGFAAVVALASVVTEERATPLTIATVPQIVQGATTPTVSFGVWVDALTELLDSTPAPGVAQEYRDLAALHHLPAENPRVRRVERLAWHAGPPHGKPAELDVKDYREATNERAELDGPGLEWLLSGKGIAPLVTQEQRAGGAAFRQSSNRRRQIDNSHETIPRACAGECLAA